jgi:hypothetical protein
MAVFVTGDSSTEDHGQLSGSLRMPAVWPPSQPIRLMTFRRNFST